jgi:hypothetical protein
VRFNSPIDADDIVLIRQMIRDGVSHEKHPMSPAGHWNTDRVLGWRSLFGVYGDS